MADTVSDVDRIRAFLATFDRPPGLHNYGATPNSADVAAGRQWQQILADAGLACLGWPAEYNGADASMQFQAAFAEETARADLPRQFHIVGPDLAGPMLIRFGSAKQRAAYLEPIRTGRHLWCQLFSEPEAGSDLAAVRTLARRNDDGSWRIDGQKVWTSGARDADMGLLLARTGDGRHGLTMFVLSMRTPGIEVRPLRQMDGEEKFNEVFLDSVVLPPDAVLGEVGQGWIIALSTLSSERLALGSQAVAMFAMLDRCRSDNPVLVNRRVELWIRVWLLRAHSHRLIETTTSAADPRFSLLKLHASELLRDITRLAVDAAGLDAIAGEDRVGVRRAFLAAPGQTIAGGTSNIQRNILAERVLGLPRESRPADD